jgi:hypothetical protein
LPDIINLRRARKAKERSVTEREAEANRRLFGRTRGEKEAEAKRRKQAERTIAGQRREPADGRD